MKPLLVMAAFVFGLFLGLPLLQWVGGWLPEIALEGKEPPVARPAPRWSTWWGGSLQKEIDAWVERRIGMRGALVRTANQMNYSLFDELPERKMGSPVLRGRAGYLFEKHYVDAYNEGKPGREAELREISASTRRLQDRLAADGIAFLLVIAPSKAEVYPEHLPPSADVAGRAARRSVYDDLIGLLRADGVNVLDAHELFLEWRRAPGTPLLFARGGTHWNDYAAGRMVAQILERLRELTGKDLPAVRMVGATTNRTVVDPDNDLGELMNLWSDRLLAGPQIHPVVEIRPGTHLPDLLVVGDSFVFPLTHFMDRERLYRRRDTFYYFKRRYSYPEAANSELDKKRLDLLGEVQGRDAVVVVQVEYWLPRIGFGFVRDLLKAYDASDRIRARPAS